MGREVKMEQAYRVFTGKLRGAGFQSYREYLQSELWRQKKAEFFEVRPRRCWVCNSEDQFEVHHKTYERVTCERLDDLVGLCGRCHEKVHSVCKEKPWIALEDAHREVAYQFDNRPQARRRRERNRGKPKKKLEGLKKLRRDAWKSKQELTGVNRQRAIANSKAKLTYAVQ